MSMDLETRMEYNEDDTFAALQREKYEYVFRAWIDCPLYWDDVGREQFFRNLGWSSIEFLEEHDRQSTPRR